MRIISGVLGGRTCVSPSDTKTTHPMSEKMRGAIFSVLGDITGLSFLDAYCGSGVIAIEAYSRCAKKVYAIDKSPKAATAVLANLDNLDVKDSIKFINYSIEHWLKYDNQKFNVIVADPPYDKLNFATIELLMELLEKTGIFVLSCPAKFEIHTLKTKLALIKQKSYGDSQLVFYSNAR
jgi:16S rRNA (guanine966-N2)-methyltransferase